MSSLSHQSVLAMHQLTGRADCVFPIENQVDYAMTVVRVRACVCVRVALQVHMYACSLQSYLARLPFVDFHWWSRQNLCFRTFLINCCSSLVVLLWAELFNLLSLTLLSAVTD